MRFLSFLLLIVFTLLAVTHVMAQRVETTLATTTTLLPATAQYFPDGTITSDTAWLVNNSKDPNFLITLFVLTDSILGYAAADDSLRIDVVYGPDDATAGFYPLNLTTQTLCNQQLQAAVPSDSGFWMTFTPPPHDRRRYYVSNSLGDTMQIASLKEIITTSAPFKR